MNERPFTIALTAFTDESFDAFVEVTTLGQPEEWTGWSGFELLFAESLSATVPDFTGTATPTAGRLTLHVDEAVLKSALPADHPTDSRQYYYVVRARPTGTYRIRLGYGRMKIGKGLPEVAP